MKYVPLTFASLTAILLIICLVEYRVHAFDGQAFSTLPPTIGFLLMFPGAELGVMVNIFLRHPTEPNLIMNLLVFYIFPLLIVAVLSLIVFFVTKGLMEAIRPDPTLRRTASGRR